MEEWCRRRVEGWKGGVEKSGGVEGWCGRK